MVVVVMEGPLLVVVVMGATACICRYGFGGGAIACGCCGGGTIAVLEMVVEEVVVVVEPHWYQVSGGDSLECNFVKSCNKGFSMDSTSVHEC